MRWKASPMSILNRFQFVFIFVILITTVKINSIVGSSVEDADHEIISARLPNSDKSEKYATSLICEVGETRHFDYQSESIFWNDIKQIINLKADIQVHCLGDDADGKFGNEALKYMLEVSNIRPDIGDKDSSEVKRIRRASTIEKIGTVLQSTWEAVKSFFKGLFRRSESSTSGGSLAREDSENECRSRRKRSTLNVDNGWSELYNKKYGLPFEFVQLADGTIPEVRFSKDETDETVKNFKRHIADAFATQLDKTKNEVVERSPLGEHISRYTVVDGGSKYTSDPGSTAGYKTEKIVLVERNISSENIIRLPGEEAKESFAMNDHELLDVDARQLHHIEGGKVIKARGFLTVKFPGTTSVRLFKRSINDDVGEYLNIKTEFSLQLRQRVKRSKFSAELKEVEKSLQFSPSSLVSSTSTKAEASAERLETWRSVLGNIPTAVDVIVTDKQNISLYAVYFLTEVVDLEMQLGRDEEGNSVSKALLEKVNKERIESICKSDISSNCYHVLRLLCRAGSEIAQQTLISTFKSDSVSLDHKIIFASLIADINKPSETSIQEFLSIVKDTSVNSDLRGAVAISLSSLAAKLPDDDELKETVASSLLAMLQDVESSGCKEDRFSFDILEALGNLGHESTVNRILEIEKACSNSELYQIETLHALHHLLHLQEVQQLLLTKIKTDSSCDVKEAIISIIEDEAYRMTVTGEGKWPRNGFNEVDNELKGKLLSGLSNEGLECGLEKAIRYFQYKNDPEAEDLIRRIESNETWSWMQQQDSQEEDSITFPRRKKRSAIGDKFKCTDWEPFQATDENISKEKGLNSVNNSNKRKRCTALKRFGPKRAGVVFQAGLQVAFPDKPEKEENQRYKLLSSFLASVNFLGADFNAGKINYLRTHDSSRVYVNVLGQTLVDTVRLNCKPLVPAQRFTTYVPLFDFTVWIVKFSLGVNLATEMMIKADCRGNSNEAFTLEPSAVVRAAGEGMGTVLMIRGGMNVGGEFNYHLNLDVDPHPEFCISGKRGYDPMKVNIETWYQLWDPFCDSWSDRRIWTPEFSQWTIKDGKQTTWLKQECFNPEVPGINPNRRGNDASESEESIPDSANEATPKDTPSWEIEPNDYANDEPAMDEPFIPSNERPMSDESGPDGETVEEDDDASIEDVEETESEEEPDGKTIEDDDDRNISKNDPVDSESSSELPNSVDEPKDSSLPDPSYRKSKPSETEGPLQTELPPHVIVKAT